MGLKSGRLFGAGILLAALAVMILDPLPVERLRFSVFDLYQRIQPRESVPPGENPVLVVGIDEKSLASMGQWPWPRNQLADLADKLIDAGARVVTFDIFFPEPDRANPLTGPSNDAVFADAIRGRPVVLGLGAADLTENRSNRPGIQSPVKIKRQSVEPYVPPAGQVIRNLPELEDAAAGKGMITTAPEADGVMRRLPTTFMSGGVAFPSLFAETMRVGLGEDRIVVRGNDIGISRVWFSRSVSVATDSGGHVWLRLPKPPFDIASAADVLAGTLAPERVGGKFVLVGAATAGLGDMKITALGDGVPGVVLHAQAVECALRGCLLSRPGYAVGAEATILLIAGGLVIVFVPIFRTWSALAFVLATAAGLMALSWFMFSSQRMLIDVSWALVCLILVYGVLLFARAKRSEKP